MVTSGLCAGGDTRFIDSGKHRDSGSKKVDVVLVVLYRSGMEGTTAKYDLVIIGAGNSGLSTALLWQKTHPEDRIVIIDKEPRPGGFIKTFTRQGFVFETTQLFPDVLPITDYLGLGLDLKEYSGNFMRRLVVHDGSVKEYHLPAGVGPLTAFLKEQFPDDAGKIQQFMDYSVELFRQVGKLKALPTLTDKIKTPLAAPRVVANLKRTYAELLDRFNITNPDLRELMETFTSFAGVPPGKASAILTTGAMLSSINQVFRPKGYFDTVPHTMARLFQERGGELLLSTTVEKIIIENGAATGVRIVKSGETIRGARVVTTIDPMVAMHKLVGNENLPDGYVEKLADIVMSPSSVNVSLGLDDAIDMTSLDLDYPYNVISTELGTTDRLFDAFLKGEDAFSESLFHLGVICPSLTTGGKNTLTIRAVPFAPQKWIELRSSDRNKYVDEKYRLGDFLIGLVETYLIPGLREHIEVVDVATPATFARYSGSPTGSIYDMASLVTQFGPKRLPMKTPIRNLYQPKFSHGIYGTMMGAVQVVDLLMDRAFNEGNSLFNPRR